MELWVARAGKRIPHGSMPSATRCSRWERLQMPLPSLSRVLVEPPCSQWGSTGDGSPIPKLPSSPGPCFPLSVPAWGQAPIWGWGGKGHTAFATLTSVSPGACAHRCWEPAPIPPHGPSPGSWVSHHRPRDHSHYLLCRCGQRWHRRAIPGDGSIPLDVGGWGAELSSPPVIFLG